MLYLPNSVREVVDGMDKNLIAFCGLYCGACSVFRSVHDRNGNYLTDKTAPIPWGACGGCRSDIIADGCRNCDFRDCATERGYRHCGECSDFPCAQLVAFDSDGVRHHAGSIASLQRLNEAGAPVWLEEQAERWKCTACGEPQHWYSRSCAYCGSSFSGFPDKETH